MDVMENSKKEFTNGDGLTSKHDEMFENYEVVAQNSVIEIPEYVNDIYPEEMQRIYYKFNPRKTTLSDKADLEAENRQLKELLFYEKEQFRVTLMSIGDGVILTDSQGVVQLINEVAEKLTGWTQNEAVGNQLETIFNIIDEY
jgi:PAS domain-containing protein